MTASKRNAASSPYSIDPRVLGGEAAGRSPLQDKLDDWVAADLINDDQADALLAYELERPTVKTSRLPLAAEAVGYIGSGLLFAAAALLIGNRWDDMSTSARILSLAAPTIVAAVAGWWTGRNDDPALQRLGSVLWLLAVVGVAGLAGEVWVDAIHDGDPPDHHAVLFVGSIALAAAAPAWWMRRVELQQLALLGATIATSLGIIDTVAAGRDRNMSAVAAGLVLLALGTIWLAGSFADRLPPPLLANLSGSALILVGAQIVRADNDHAGLWLGLVASIALMATGVARSELEVLFMGTAGLFQWTPQIALFYLEDTLGTEATLFVIGTVLIVLAGLLTRIYPWVTARRSDTPPPPHDTTTASEETASASEEPQERPRGGTRLGLPLMFGGPIIALVLVAVITQWFGSTESDDERNFQESQPGLEGVDLSRSEDDDRGPVVDEEWSIALNDGGAGSHTVVMIKTFTPLRESDIEDLGGHLNWEETDVELCNIGIRSVGDGFVQIGDIFQTTEGCGSDSNMQEVFEEFWPPKFACVYVKADGLDNEYCAPLTVD